MTTKIDAINTTEAGKYLGVTRVWIRVLIRQGRLPAVKIGRDWVIQEADLAALPPRHLGRPKTKQPRKKKNERN